MYQGVGEGYGVCTREWGRGMECVPEGAGEGVEGVPGQRIMAWVNSSHA